MAADITSRSISGEFDNSNEKTSPETSSEEGYITIDNIAGDFNFVLLHALELFSEFQESIDGETHLENSVHNHECNTLDFPESTSENSDSNASTTISLIDWDIINSDIQEINSTVVDTHSQEINSSSNMDHSVHSSEEDHSQAKADLGIIDHVNPEKTEPQTLAEELNEECEQSNKEITEDSDELVEKIRSMEFNFFTHKHSKHKLKKKKWKPAPSSILRFDFCLLSFRQNSECSDLEILQDYEHELQKFENELHKKEITSIKESGASVDLKESAQEPALPVSGAQETKSSETETANATEQVLTPADSSEISVLQTKSKRNRLKRRSKNRPKRDQAWDNAEYYCFENVDAVEMLEKIQSRTLAVLDKYEGVNAEKRLRNKRKWSYVKGHKAKRIVLGEGKSVYRPMKRVYINRRAICSVNSNGCRRRREILATRSLKEIDKGSYPNGIIPPSGYQNAEAPRIYDRQQNANNRQNNRNAPQPRYALNRNNADNNLEADLVNVLINLQDRDLTPEDYELLLRLDERVAPKTVTQGLVDSLLTDTATEEDTKEACTICMDCYVFGQERKYLPCGHVFHTNCIEQWLTNSSQNCPLDNMPVEPS